MRAVTNAFGRLMRDKKVSDAFMEKTKQEKIKDPIITATNGKRYRIVRVSN